MLGGNAAPPFPLVGEVILSRLAWPHRPVADPEVLRVGREPREQVIIPIDDGPSAVVVEIHFIQRDSIPFIRTRPAEGDQDLVQRLFGEADRRMVTSNGAIKSSARR